MNIIIRKTDKSEYFQTEYLTREAFWNLYQPKVANILYFIISENQIHISVIQI